MIVLQTHGLAERLGEILRDYDVSLAPDAKKIGGLSGGFEIPSLKLHSNRNRYFRRIFHNTNKKPKTKDQKPKTNLGAFISDFRDLKIGDFVVHVDHGIARFEGLQVITSNGAEREFMLLIYAENSKLFVPVEKIGFGFALFVGRSDRADFRPFGRTRLAKNKSQSETRNARYG